MDLYTVKDGELRKLRISTERIGTGPISVEGYVCGVVLFCPADTNATVDGEKMLRGDRNKREDSSKNSGGSEELSRFPAVTGDTVSPNHDFLITVRSGGEVLEIPIRHSGYQTLPTPLDARTLNAGITFRYLGSRPSLFEARDFENKLRAVTQGIEAVERTFGAHLVRHVNIINYDGIENAVTQDGQGGIWFYARALKHEPLDDLKIMAEHEALHLLVEQGRLTKSSQLREIFADLIGFDLLSYERLLLLTKGVTILNGVAPKNDRSMFFSFIDEKNFIPGAKGGHSRESLAEFCTSFFHSLMYLDLLKTNLTTFLVPGDPGKRHLNSQEKHFVVQTYLKLIEISTDMVDLPVSPVSSAGPDATKSLLDKARAEIRKGT